MTPRDLQAVVAALVKKAKRGDVPAARELFDRLFGKPTATIEHSGETPADDYGVVIYLPDNGRESGALDVIAREVKTEELTTRAAK